MDLCTVVFRDELNILKTQARSIARWLDDIDNIIVVVNDDVEIAEQIDPQDWQQYADRVQIVHRNHFGNRWCDNGWVSQQALKIAAADQSTSEWCLVLDAKTIFVRYLPEMFDHGRLCVGTMPVYEVFEPSRQIVNQLWNIDLQQQLGPGGVPFWFNTHEVRDMITDIESRTGQEFVQWFQDQGRLTEFILYSGWIEHKHGLANVVADNRVRPCNVCHSEVNMADTKLKQMHASHTVSIHRHAWSQMSPSQHRTYQQFLEDRLYR